MFILDIFDNNDRKGKLPEGEFERNPEPEQQQIDVNRAAALRREREPEGSEKIDAMLAARNAQRQEYERSGKFWLKTKTEQKHLQGPFIGKAAANAAALALLKQAPELRGNLLITAYGPGEQQGVDEGEIVPFGRTELERWKNNVMRFYPEVARKLQFDKDRKISNRVVAIDPSTGIYYGDFNTLTNKGQVFNADAIDEGSLTAFERDPFERWKKNVAMMYPGIAKNLIFAPKGLKGEKIVAMDRFSRITYGDFDMETMKGRIFDAANDFAEGKTGPGLWANIHAKRERIKHGSGERMRKPGSKGAPTAQNFKDAAKEDVAEVRGETPEKEIERLKLRQNAEHGSASLKRQAATQARIRELEKQIKDKKKNVTEGSSDYVGNAIEDLRVSMPGLDRETFLDELYSYLDARFSKRVADMTMDHGNDDVYDEWYDYYSDSSRHDMEEAYPGHIQKGKELDAATKKIQANLDRRIRGKELDAATKEIQKNLDKRIKKVDKDVAEGSLPPSPKPQWSDEQNAKRQHTQKELKRAQFLKKKAAQAPTKGMSNTEKADKGWRNPNVEEQGVAEGFKNTYNVGDRVDGPLGTGTIVAVSRNVNVDGRVKVKLDDPSRAGEDGKYKDSFVLDTTQLKHISEQGVAETSTPSDQPRIRKYSKIRADGSKAERFEVLDYQGRRASGQGPEGFDNVQAAKEFYYRNYDKLQAPVEESEYEGPRGKVTIDRSVPGRTVVRNVDPGQSFPTNIQGPKPVPKSKLGPAPIIPQDDHMKYDDEENMPDDPNYDPTKIKEAAGRRYWCKNEKRWKDVE